MPSSKNRVYPAQGEEHPIVKTPKPPAVEVRSVTDTTSHTAASSSHSSIASGSGGGGSPNENKIPSEVVQQQQQQQAFSSSKGTIDQLMSTKGSATAALGGKRIMENTAPATAEQAVIAQQDPMKTSTPPKSRRKKGRSNSDIPVSVHRRSHSDIPASVVQGSFGGAGFGQNYTGPSSYGTPPPPPPPAYSPQFYGAGGQMMPPPYSLGPQQKQQQRYYSPRTIAGAPPGTPPPPPPSRGTPPRSSYHARSNSQHLVGEKKPLLDESAKNGRRQHRREKRRGQHRKTKSSSAATPGSYGAFWGEQEQQQQQGQKFSPRAEFRKLTQKISPTTISSRKQLLEPFANSPFSASSRGFDPALDDENVSFFRQHRHKMESSRKMHMRQKSAQLFMQDTKGVEQELTCRNVGFLLIFVFHLLFIGYLGGKFGGKALEYHDPAKASEVTIFYKNLVMIAVWSGAFAAGVSGLLLGAMSIFARNFVKVALIIIITLSFMWGTIGIGWSPKTVVPVTGIIALALAVAYTFIVWDRIPFAAANLLTALSGIRANPGTLVVAFGFQALALAWSVYYAIVVSGIYDAIQEEGRLDLSQPMAYFVYVLLGISYYWTFQVLTGTVQAITAGVIGGWWHTPEKEGIVRISCFKTLFYSMGSICFGSLFVGPVGILRQLSAFFRPSSSDSTSLLCFHECMHCIQTCVTSCVDTIASGCNYWAFTYIGLYHYGFLDAGHNATELFERRGWSTIVSDDLVPNVLFLTSLMIGGVTGCFSYLISQIDRLEVTTEGGHGTAAFFEGAVIGLVLTSVIFCVISGSVNAVLVCFASSPVDFEHNHPELSHEMRSSWRDVWPGALDVCDLRLALEQGGTSTRRIRAMSASFEEQPLLL